MNARILPDGMMLIGRDVTGMGSPVQCSYCGKAYDLQGAPKGEPGYIELIHRYADCDLFVGDMYDADLYCRCGHWSAGQEPQPHLLWIEHAKSSPVPLTLAVGDLS
jgi:hypothetical protein